MADESKYLLKAEQAYNDLKAGKSVGLKNEEAIREAILKGQLRWGMTSKGSFKPLTPDDSDYDKGYASPREALHFVKGAEPSRTEPGKFFGSIVAPVSQHRIEGDPVRSQQRDAVADYGQDILRGATKFALPLAVTVGMRSPIGAALAGGGSSLGGALANMGWSAARHDPYGDDPGQALTTALATGAGIGLGRRYTPTRQAGRWAESEASQRLRNFGISQELADEAAAEVTRRLTHGLPEYTYGEFKYKPLTDFDTKTGAPDMPVKMREMALPMDLTNKRIMPRGPKSTKQIITTEATTDIVPGGKKMSTTKSKQVTTKGDNVTTTKSDAATFNGKTAKTTTKTTVKPQYHEVTDAEARDWLKRNGISAGKPGAIEQAKYLIEKGWFSPESEYGQILFGKGGETGLTKKELTRYLVDQKVPEVARDILRTKVGFDDPELDKNWRLAKDELGKRASMIQGKDDTGIVSATEFNERRGTWRTKAKSGAAALGGFLLPIAAELLYTPIKRKVTNE